MTQEEFEKKIKDKIAKLKVAELIMPYAISANSEMSARIFEDGKNGNGVKIGNYSTDEMYAGVRKFNNKGRFRPKGKSGAVKFKNGNVRKTMYLKNGYKELRQLQGYESSFVNLQYTGDLMTDFTKVKPVGDKVIVSVSRGINDKKIQGIENRYGKSVFKHTKDERKKFTEKVTKALKKYLE